MRIMLEDQVADGVDLGLEDHLPSVQLLSLCAHGCWDEDLDHNDEDGGGSSYKDYNDYDEDDDNNGITNGKKKWFDIFN